MKQFPHFLCDKTQCWQSSKVTPSHNRMSQSNLCQGSNICKSASKFQTKSVLRWHHKPPLGRKLQNSWHPKHHFYWYSWIFKIDWNNNELMLIPYVVTCESKTQETHHNGYNLPIYQVCHLHISIINVLERKYQSWQGKKSLKEKLKWGLQTGLKDHWDGGDGLLIFKFF